MESPANEITATILSQPFDLGTKRRLLVGIAQELTVDQVIESLITIIADMHDRMEAPLAAHYRE